MWAKRIGLPSFLISTILIAISPALYAQVADSSQTAVEEVDSTAVTPPVVQVPDAPPLVPDPYRQGVPVDTVPLVRIFEYDIVELLDAIPGSFRYSLGNIGWPDQWSSQGEPANGITLTLDNVPVRDPVAGRPMFEMLPVDLLESPTTTQAPNGSVMGVGLYTRSFQTNKPLTELRYRAGGQGLQSISATHVQERRLRLLGSKKRLQVLFRYGAGDWTGDYPNSTSEHSQVYARVGIFAPKWAVRISNSHSRRNGGAHRGVVQRSGDYDSIFTQFNASVNEPNATFRIKRNDVRLSIDRSVFNDLSPLSMTLSWVSHMRRYENDQTSRVLVQEYALMAAQELPNIVGKSVVARITARVDDVDNNSLLSDSTHSSRSFLETAIENKGTFGAAHYQGHLGFVTDHDWSYPEGALTVQLGQLGTALTADLGISGRAPTRLQSEGTDRITAMDSVSLDRESLVTVGLTIARSLGASGISLRAFTTKRSRALEILHVESDSFRVAQSDPSVSRFGITGVFRWRTLTKRGFYSEIQSTVEGSSSANGDPLLTAIEESIPKFHSRIRFGTKYLLFQGDLNMDLYLIGRYWSSFESRVFDPTTGILALSGDGAISVGATGTLDLRIEAGIRSATAYVGFDNVLAGSSYPGASLVPYYPLPARAFRFGVFWPITD